MQHHHAHVASAIAEHGLEGPVLGLAWDGTGYGSDGTAWGGELLLVDGASYERLATLRPLRLAGGDEAIRQVWRIALAALDDAFDGTPPLERLRLFDEVAPRELAVVRQAAAKGVNTPLAHGAGRWFDALGALGPCAARGRATRARSRSSGTWPRPTADCGSVPVRAGGRRPAACRPTCGRWCARRRCDLVAAVAPAVVSARFHETMADVAAAMVRRAGAATARLPVVLTGGCFQNARLVECVLSRLGWRARGGAPPPRAPGRRRDRARTGARGRAGGMMGGPLPFTARLVALRDGPGAAGPGA